LFRLGGVEDSALSNDVMIRNMSGHHSLQNGVEVNKIKAYSFKKMEPHMQRKDRIAPTPPQYLSSRSF